MRRNTVQSSVLAIAAILTTACSPNIDPHSAADAIRSMDEKWSAVAAKNDLEGTLGFYAEDAVLLPPNAPIANSRKSIRESWAGLLGPNTAVSWKASKVETAKSGDLGYLYGTYKLSIQDAKGGQAIADRGKIVEVWKKQRDGEWRCIVDTYNSDIPVSATPATKG